MHHLYRLHFHKNQCSICAKFVLKTIMLFYFVVKEKDCWNGLGASLDHEVTTGGKHTSKISQN